MSFQGWLNRCCTRTTYNQNLPAKPRRRPGVAQSRKTSAPASPHRARTRTDFEPARPRHAHRPARSRRARNPLLKRHEKEGTHRPAPLRPRFGTRHRDDPRRQREERPPATAGRARRRKTKTQGLRRPGCNKPVAPLGLQTADSRCGPRDNRGPRPTAIRLSPRCRHAGVTGRTRLATQRFHGRQKDPIKRLFVIQRRSFPTGRYYALL